VKVGPEPVQSTSDVVVVEHNSHPMNRYIMCVRAQIGVA
jgi:hypothetical protein